MCAFPLLVLFDLFYTKGQGHYRGRVEKYVQNEIVNPSGKHSRNINSSSKSGKIKVCLRLLTKEKG